MYSNARISPLGGGGLSAIVLPMMRNRSRGPAYTMPDLNDCHAWGVCGPIKGQRFVRSHSVCSICFFQSEGSGYCTWAKFRSNTPVSSAGMFIVICVGESTDTTCVNGLTPSPLIPQFLVSALVSATVAVVLP